MFDHGWADAFERAGGRYYPKLQVAVPFTPATGPRLLVSRGADRTTGKAGARGRAEGGDRAARRLLRACDLCDGGRRRGPRRAPGSCAAPTSSSISSTRATAATTISSATLASRKRKALKKERREALAHGISIDWLTGGDLTEAAWDDFFAFYMDTGGRKWGRPYLNRKFFSLIGERMADDVLLVMARRNGRYIAGAINFIGSDALYGRNWGCIEDHPFLHFEVCYHQAIDFAIAKGLKVVEAGAQGEHKLARGYMPVTMQSAHYIPHPGLRARGRRLPRARAPRSGADGRVSGRARAVPARRAAGRGMTVRTVAARWQARPRPC